MEIRPKQPSAKGGAEVFTGDGPGTVGSVASPEAARSTLRLVPR